MPLDYGKTAGPFSRPDEPLAYDRSNLAEVARWTSGRDQPGDAGDLLLGGHQLITNQATDVRSPTGPLR